MKVCVCVWHKNERGKHTIRVEFYDDIINARDEHAIKIYDLPPTEWQISQITNEHKFNFIIFINFFFLFQMINWGVYFVFYGIASEKKNGNGKNADDLIEIRKYFSKMCEWCASVSGQTVGRWPLMCSAAVTNCSVWLNFVPTNENVTYQLSDRFINVFK